MGYFLLLAFLSKVCSIPTTKTIKATEICIKNRKFVSRLLAKFILLVFPINSLPEDGTVVRRIFHLDPETGVLSTKVKLDREERSNYTLIVDVADLGSPPQQV